MPDSLPIWDLTDLYTDSSTSIQLDLDTAKQQTEKLVQHEGRLSQMTGAELADVIAEYQSDTDGEACNGDRLKEEALCCL